MLTCVLFGIISSQLAYVIALRSFRGRRLYAFAYLTACAVTCLLSVCLAIIGEGFFDFSPADACLILIKGGLFGAILPAHGLWMASRAEDRSKQVEPSVFRIGVA